MVPEDLGLSEVGLNGGAIPCPSMGDAEFIAHVRRRHVLSTGQVARICGVAPRTVCKWFDTGRLKGYRIPGSMDRRIPKDELVRFMREAGMPLRGMDRPMAIVLTVTADPYLPAGAATVLGGDWNVRHAPGTVAGAAVLIEAHPDCLVLDFALGRVPCGELLTLARQLPIMPVALGMVPEDMHPDAVAAQCGLKAALAHPVSPLMMADSIVRAVRRAS